MACYRAAQRAGAYCKPVETHKRYAECARCGVGFSRSKSRTRSGKLSENIYCSRDCYDAARIEARGFCDHCGERLPSTGLEARRRYCSMECRKLGMKAKPSTCITCGVTFTGIQFKRRNGIARGYSSKPRKTCSDECLRDYYRTDEDRKKKIGAAFSGDKHPQWMGGLAQLNNVANRGPGWAKIRLKALKRDGFCCVDCGMSNDESLEKYGRGLDVDHVEPYHNFGKSSEANRLSNLKSRCASCHRKAEAKRKFRQMALPFGPTHRTHRGYKNGACA